MRSPDGFVAGHRERDLVFAGGVALNCVANARLEREGPFRSLFILGAAHDAGTAIGAALDDRVRKRLSASKSEGLRRPACSHAVSRALRIDDCAIEAAIARSGFSSEKVDDPAGMAACSGRRRPDRRLVSGADRVRSQGPGQSFAARGPPRRSGSR